MTDDTAKIKGKGLDGTGFTEALAASLFNRVGHHMLAIVELQVVDKHGPNLKGQRGIELVITQIEPAEDSNLEDHLRELTRTLHYNRGLQGHVGTTTEGQERTVADVLSAGGKFKPHPFLPDDAAKDTPICDVCGGIEASAVHSTQDILDDPDDEDAQDAAADVEAEQNLIAEEWVDSQHGDAPEQPDDDWSYPAPEGQAATVPDPFTTPATT